jgi:SprB repeat/Secretion system C-terminal sorting domain
MLAAHFNMRDMRMYLIILCLLLVNHLKASDTLYVNQIAPGSNTGQSWTNAYTQAHTAILNAKYGDHIWIAYGNYALANSKVLPRLSLPNGVKLIGNFAGFETSPSQRNMDTIQTVFTRDFDTSLDSAQYYTGCLMVSGTDSTTLINGIQFRTGLLSTLDPNLNLLGCDNYRCWGGAIFLYADSLHSSTYLTVSECRFDSCRAGIAAIGGVAVLGKINLNIDSCTFYQNESTTGAGAVQLETDTGIMTVSITHSLFDGNDGRSFGYGAIQIRANLKSLITLEKCRFTNSIGSFFSKPADATVLIFSNNTFIKDCIFEQNGPKTNSTRIFCGGLSVAGENCLIDRCIFKENRGYTGGLRSSCTNLNVKNCLFKNNQGLTDKLYASVFTNYSFSNRKQQIHFTNCTFDQNRNKNTQGCLSFSFSDTSDYAIRNCIFTGNLQNGSPDSLIYLIFPDTFKVENCFFDFPDSVSLRNKGIHSVNWLTAPYINRDSIEISGQNIYGQDPLYVDTATLDYRLFGCSPAADAGTPVNIGLFDLYGMPRVQNTKIDIGAAESTLFKIYSSVDQPKCFDAQDGSISIVTNGGIPPLLANWSTLDTGFILEPVSAGQYMVTLTESGKCPQSLTILVEQPNQLVLTSIIKSPTSAMSQDGAITITPSGGVLPYLYLWNTGATTSTLSNIPIGTYSCTLTDANNCSTTAIYRIATSSTSYVNHKQYRISPNPVTDRLQLTPDLENYSLFITDLTGRVVLKSSPKDELNSLVDTSSLVDGLYYLFLFEGDIMVFSGKFVKI